MAQPVANMPPIPAKRYFTVGEVAQLAGVSVEQLREWESVFLPLQPRRSMAQRRYYQHHEVLIARRLRTLLVDEEYTLNGLRRRLRERDGLSPAQLRAELQGLLSSAQAPLSATR